MFSFDIYIWLQHIYWTTTRLRFETARLLLFEEKPTQEGTRPHARISGWVEYGVGDSSFSLLISFRLNPTLSPYDCSSPGWFLGHNCHPLCIRSSRLSTKTNNKKERTLKVFPFSSMSRSLSLLVKRNDLFVRYRGVRGLAGLTHRRIEL